MTPADLVVFEAFSHTIEQWHDFYLLSGTAAATLVGLLFIALSLHVDVIVRDDGEHFKLLAFESFFSFLIVLIVSLGMLVPNPTPRPLGAELLMMAVVRLATMVPGARTMLRLVSASGDRRTLLRFGLPAIGYVLLALSGLLVIRGRTEEGLATVVTSLFLLMISGSRSAWDLMVRIARVKQDRSESTQ